MNDTLILNHSEVGSDIEDILGLRDMSEDEQGLFLDAVGALVIESSVTKYVVSVMPEERMTFEQWLEAHQKDEDLLEKACQTHPLFAEILTEEMEVFQSEAKRLFGARS
jgi:hypothetical protein